MLAALAIAIARSSGACAPVVSRGDDGIMRDIRSPVELRGKGFWRGPVRDISAQPLALLAPVVLGFRRSI